MRWVICALVVLGIATPALAQDFDILRGSESVGPATFTNWSGFYFGGHLGYSDGNAEFANSTQAPIAYVMRDTALEADSDPSDLPVLGTADHTALSYGGFVGYNSQWQNLVLGLEGNFNHMTFALNAPSSPISRSELPDGDGNYFTIGITATGTLTDLNYLELRGRAGVILDNFLPYGFLGPVVGLANVNINAGVEGTCDSGSNPTCTGFAFTANGGKNSAILYGGVAGLGLEYAITRNVFLRTEYEYLRFAPFDDVLITINSVRVGAGVKF